MHIMVVCKCNVSYCRLICKASVLSIKHATYKATKRLREEGNLVKDDDRPGVVGRPKKIARVIDLQAVYPALTR